MKTAEPILRVEDLSKRFGGVQALSAMGFALPPGGILGIIGPNGSGKTTLINALTGFVRVDAGRVVFQGRDITNLAPHKIAGLGLTRTFQMARPFASLPAHKNLAVPLFSRRARKNQSRSEHRMGRDKEALRLLEKVGIPLDLETVEKPASVLSHGRIKSLELARCLALRPEIIICDELLSGLSPVETASLTPLLGRINRQGIALILVEHRLRELFRLTQRILVLNFGRKLMEGDPSQVMADETVKDAYFGARGGDNHA